MNENEKNISDETLEKVSGGVRLGRDGKPDFRKKDEDNIHVTSATFGPEDDHIHVTSATFGPEDDHIHVTSATF